LRRVPWAIGGGRWGAGDEVVGRARVVRSSWVLVSWGCRWMPP
jgi:hypothetical protein